MLQTSDFQALQVVRLTTRAYRELEHVYRVHNRWVVHAILLKLSSIDLFSARCLAEFVIELFCLCLVVSLIMF